MVSRKPLNISMSISRLAYLLWASFSVFRMLRCFLSLVAENRSFSKNMSTIACSPLRKGAIAFVSSELEKFYTLTTSIEPTTFVGMDITRDRPNKSLTLTQPHFVGKIIDLYSVPSSSVNIQCPKIF